MAAEQRRRGGPCVRRARVSQPASPHNGEDDVRLLLLCSQNSTTSLYGVSEPARGVYVLTVNVKTALGYKSTESFDD